MYQRIRGQGSHNLGRMGRLSLVAVAAIGAAACGSTSGTSSATASATNPGVPSTISVSAFTPDIASTMSLLKPLTKYATKGANSLLIGVILPDTTSSVRWVDFDQPYLTDAFADAGFSSTAVQRPERPGQ